MILINSNVLLSNYTKDEDLRDKIRYIGGWELAYLNPRLIIMHRREIIRNRNRIPDIEIRGV